MARRSTSKPSRHHEFQNDTLNRENDTESAAIVRSGKPDLGFPPEHHGGRWENHNDDTYIKVTTPAGAAIVGPDRIGARLSPAIINTSRSSASSGRKPGMARHRREPCHPRSPLSRWIHPASTPKGRDAGATDLHRRAEDPRCLPRRRCRARRRRGARRPRHARGEEDQPAPVPNSSRTIDPPRRRQRPGFAWPRPWWQRGRMEGGVVGDRGGDGS